MHFSFQISEESFVIFNSGAIPECKKGEEFEMLRMNYVNDKMITFY